MSADIHKQRNWLIAGIVVLAILFIAIVVALIWSIQNRDGEAQIGGRSPAAELAYCAPQDEGLCVVSFGQLENGDIVVNFQVPRPNYPRFNLTIVRYGSESTYECRRVRGVPTGVICTGPSQAPGEVLQFKVIARRQGTLLAEGKFAIIGIALATLEPITTPTFEEPAMTEAPATEAPLFPTQVVETPVTSYPNPPPNPTSYP